MSSKVSFGKSFFINIVCLDLLTSTVFKFALFNLHSVCHLLLQVIELGGIPTIGDCAMILRAAIKAPLPSAFLKILQTTHGLGYVFGRYVCKKGVFLLFLLERKKLS